MPGLRVLDVGCAEGWLAGELLASGSDVVGVDFREEAIASARAAFPRGRFYVATVHRDLIKEIEEEPFDAVVSTEVIEHVYDPHGFVAGCFRALRPGGRFVCSTPYHGYLKNVAIAVSGRFDYHVDPLLPRGHIKFWSKRTLFRLLADGGFTGMTMRGVGRAPLLWKSMVVAARRPDAQTPNEGMARLSVESDTHSLDGSSLSSDRWDPLSRLALSGMRWCGVLGTGA